MAVRNVVDDERFRWSFLRFEAQPELLHARRQKSGRPVGLRRRGEFRRRGQAIAVGAVMGVWTPLKLDIVLAGDARSCPERGRPTELAQIAAAQRLRRSTRFADYLMSPRLRLMDLDPSFSLVHFWSALPYRRRRLSFTLFGWIASWNRSARRRTWPAPEGCTQWPAIPQGRQTASGNRVGTS